jgi:DNA processing protein
MIPGVSVGLYHDLLRRLGGPAEVLRTAPAALEGAGVPRPVAAAIASGGHRGAAEQDVASAEQAGVRIVTWADPAYPALLRHIHDPPPYLYVRGLLAAGDEAAVAVVGSRAASGYGLDAATTFGRDLAAAGITVVSGLAHGIDAAAHRGALVAGGRTIAVLGSGIDVTYPSEHEELAAQIASQGAVVSEFFMGTGPRPSHFPVRNRTISGLSRAVLVVEATERSGSLITARLGLEQGRDVFAVPGPINAPRSRGTHRLIRDGARLVTAASELLDELNLAASRRPQVEQPLPFSLDAFDSEARSVVDALSSGVEAVDGVVAQTGLTPQEVLRILLQLELSGVVRQFPGVTWRAVS